MDEMTQLREYRRAAESGDESAARAALDARIAEEERNLRERSSKIGRFGRVRVAILSIVLGGAVGFGIATWNAPAGSASNPVVGFGFLPAHGWTVMQSGTVGTTGAATAIAANVPLHGDDRVGRAPSATLRALSPGGVVIWVTFTTRGDPAVDATFAERRLPLQIANARRVLAAATPLPLARSIASYRLRAAVEGYNIDARIYYGSARPPSGLVNEAQQQLSRLVVAAEAVTISARPTLAGNGQPVRVFGSVDGGKEGDIVEIETKDCGQDFYRGVVAARTGAGGAWSAVYYPPINTSVRAVWNGRASAPIAIRKRAGVMLRQLSATRFSVWAGGGGPGGPTVGPPKRVLFQRFDRRLGRWNTVKQVVLRASYDYTPFTASLPKGTLVRAVMPLAQAKPCYVTGYSRTFRVER